MSVLRKLEGREFNGYLRVRIPHRLDEVVDSVVDAYRTSSLPEQTDMLEKMRLPTAQVLNAYAQRMAAVAVRRSSEEAIRNALIGLGMSHVMMDYRESLIVLATINHAACMLGRDLSEFIDDVAPLLPDAAIERFRGFTRWEPHDKSLATMHLRTEGTGDEFRYV